MFPYASVSQTVFQYIFSSTILLFSSAPTVIVTSKPLRNVGSFLCLCGSSLRVEILCLSENVMTPSQISLKWQDERLVSKVLIIPLIKLAEFLMSPILLEAKYSIYQLF